MWSATDREAYTNSARATRFPGPAAAGQEPSTKISPLLRCWKPRRGLLKPNILGQRGEGHDATDKTIGEQTNRSGHDRGSASIVSRGVRAAVQRRNLKLF